jgi:hypothetical protein
VTNDHTERIDETAPAEAFDDVLRWIIPSDYDPHVSYVVELDSYQKNGECQCEHFEMRLRPLLSRMVTPEEAVASGLVKLKKGTRVEDALRCKHILDAQKRFACAMVGALSNMRKANEKLLRKNAQTITPPPRNRVA